MEKSLPALTPEQRKELVEKETVDTPSGSVFEEKTPSINYKDLSTEINIQDKDLLKQSLQDHKIRFERFKIIHHKLKTPQKSELMKLISSSIGKYEDKLQVLDALIQYSNKNEGASERITKSILDNIEDKKALIEKINQNVLNLFSRIEKEKDIYNVIDDDKLSESKKTQELNLIARDSVKSLDLSSEIKNHIANRYVLLGELAAGGMGVAYDAYDHRLRKSAVVKMIKPAEGHFISKRSLEMFRNEGRAIAKLQHPNIVNIYEMEVDSTGAFYGIEKAEKGDLSSEIKKGKLDEKKTINMAIDVLKGLVEMHKINLVHRDLKPANIFKADYGYMIGDFGLVKNLDEEQTKILGLEEMLKNSLSGTIEEFDNKSFKKILEELRKSKDLQSEFFEHQHQSSQKALELFKELRLLASDISLNDIITIQFSGIKGTPSFASPEQMLGTQTTPKSDIFSMGTVLYVAATRKNPFNEKTLKKVIQSLQYKNVDPLSETKTSFPVSEELSDLVEKMMSKDLNERPDSEEVLSELMKIQSKYDYN